MAERELTLFGRLECHLCQDMLNDIEPLKEELGFELKIIDIDVVDKIKIPQLKSRITKLIAQKLGVDLGFEL